MDSESAIIRLSELQERGALKPDSEDALALLFAQRYANQLRFVAMWGRWLRYDGVCWSFDDTLHIFDLVRDICREAPASPRTPAAVRPANC
jgi:D5 N terminal like